MDSAAVSINKLEGWRPRGLASSVQLRLAAAGGGTILLSTSDSQIFLWSKDSGAEAIAVELPRSAKPEGSRVQRLFVDPTGRHALACLESAGSGATYYMSFSPTANYSASSATSSSSSSASSSTRPQARELQGLRGYSIESVAWSKSSSSSSKIRDESKTGPILFGTSNGRILLARIEDKKEKGPVQLLWDSAPSSGGEVLPLVGLLWESYGALSAANGGDPSRHYIFAVTSRPLLRYFEFSGGPTIEDVFADAAAKPVVFREIRGGPEVSGPVPADLQTHRIGSVGKSGSSLDGSIPEGLSFLTGVGLYTLSCKQQGSAVVVTDPKLLQYPTLASPSATKEFMNSIDNDRYNGRQSVLAGDGLPGLSSSSSSSSSSTPSVPLGLAVTDFHFLFLYRQRIVAVSRISLSVVFEQVLSEDRHGVVRHIFLDKESGGAGNNGLTSSTGSGGTNIMILSDRGILDVNLSDEARGAWKLHLARNEFEAARKSVRGDEAKLEKIHVAEAEFLFQSGQTQAAAQAFARTRMPFEETCLRFLAGGHRSALQSYLKNILEGLSSTKAKKGAPAERDQKFAPQRTIICTWLVEMMLDRLDSLQSAATEQGGEAEEEYVSVSNELRDLLQSHDKDVDRATILALMAGHNRTDELLYYWRTIGEWGKIVSHHMNKGEWSDAISAILDAPSSSVENDQNSQENLWYRHSSVLMGIVPAETVEGWKGCLELKPARLIPTLVRYEQVRAISQDGSKSSSTSTSVNAVAESLDIAMLYLEWAVRTGVVSRNRRDPSVRAIHNLLLSLYARQPAEDLLLRYIEEQSSQMPPVPPAGAAGSISEHGMSSALAVELAEREHEEAEAAERNAREGISDSNTDYDSTSGPHFDLTYALRVCLTAGKQRACVLLYCCMGLYVEAVDLALKVDVGLAKEAADRPPKEETLLRKRLWTKIAVHVVSAGGGAAAAIDVMQDSNCLRIEDVLSYFPGSTTIGDFKNEVTQSLKEADLSIAALRSEMRDYTQAAERIRSDIKALRSRCGSVRVGQRCDLCRTAVLSRHFYLFPCGHAFHSDCLMADMVLHLNSSQRRRVSELTQAVQRAQSILQQLSDGGGSSGSAGGNSTLSVPTLRAELATLNSVCGIVNGPGGLSSSTADLRSLYASRAEDVQAELDKSVAKECLFCGEIMVRSIADPLDYDYAASDAFSSGLDTPRNKLQEWSI
jgi:hypothetical protein